MHCLYAPVNPCVISSSEWYYSVGGSWDSLLLFVQLSLIGEDRGEERFVMGLELQPCQILAYTVEPRMTMEIKQNYRGNSQLNCLKVIISLSQTLTNTTSLCHRLFLKHKHIHSLSVPYNSFPQCFLSMSCLYDWTIIQLTFHTFKYLPYFLLCYSMYGQSITAAVPLITICYAMLWPAWCVVMMSESNLVSEHIILFCM